MNEVIITSRIASRSTFKTKNTFIFRKKVFSLKTFINHIRLMFKYRTAMKDISRNKIISEIFVEHLMLVCTAVNDCVYCAWGHRGMAHSIGISDEEIDQILSLNFINTPSFERTALEFAKEYALTNGKPETSLVKKLVQEYGKQKANAIIASILMITTGNLAGNTLSSFIYRIKGGKLDNNNLPFELLVFFPIGFFLHLLYLKKGK